MADMKRTSLNLDFDIVKEAKELARKEYIEYPTSSEIIRHALREFVEKRQFSKKT